MKSNLLAKLCFGRVHYAWVVLVVIFTMTLAVVGVRAAPGVMIVPLQHAFGWSVGTISGAVSLNILLMGVTGVALADDFAGLNIEGSEPTALVRNDPGPLTKIYPP